MKRIKLILVSILCVCFSRPIVAQEELKTGFAMLEKGDFADGAAFFKQYLKKDSTNKTALLCYGRGIGLSGDVPEAQRTFAKLLARYPGDFEVSMNDAESYMWAKDYKSAKAYYEKLLVTHPNDFAANLGYANALASLFEYENALKVVNKAIELAPTNQSAKVSRKYARLGLADQYSKNQFYLKAVPVLDEIFVDFPDDIDALGAKAQLNIMLEKYDVSEKIYKQLLELTHGKTEIYLSLSYLSFLQKNKTLAFDYTTKAIQSTKTQPTKYLMARLGRATALGWNSKFKQVFYELDSLDKVYPDNTDILLKRAGLKTWDKEYALSASLFKKALAKVPSSFDGNLGCADALFAQELDYESESYVQKTLGYYPNQKDAKDFLTKIDLRHSPSVTTHNFLSTDNGGNSSTNYNLIVAFDIVRPFRLNFNYKSREASFSVDNSSAKTEAIGVGFRWRVKPRWLMTTNVNNVTLKGQVIDKSHVLVDFINEFALTKIQSLELRYQKDVQNFTAGLIEKNLTFENFVATYNLNTPFKVGVYSQLYYTLNSDGNSRNLLFASVYYDVKAAPVIKGGINFNYMTFQQQKPSDYFSPDQFRGYELFGLIENLQVPKQKFLYQFMAAGGYQQIGTKPFQSTYRVQATLGYRPFQNFEATVYGMQSTSNDSPSNTDAAKGYSYQELGLKAKWILLRKRKF